MPTYVYKAKNNAAQTIAGRLSAHNQDDAVEAVHQLGLVPIAVEEETAQGVLVSHIHAGNVRSKDLYAFTKQLAGLVKSGVALLRGLELISRQPKNPYFAKTIADLALGVKAGRSFSSCLADYPAIFSPLYVAMVHAGEEMGNMKDMLAQIAAFQKRQEEISGKVKSALVYPMIMLGVGVLTVAFILTFVMPRIAGIFSDASQHLPWPTVIVLSISRFLKIFWVPLGLGVTAGVVMINRWRQTSKGQITVGRFLLTVPAVKDLVIKADLARFVRTLHLLLQSGLPLVQAIEIAIPTIENPLLRQDLFICAQGLTAGHNLGSCLRNSTLIPDLMTQSLTVAEESGSLNDALADIADTYEADVEEAARLLTTLLEPLMILAIGLVVGFIIFAMLLPIFSMDILAR